MANVPSSTFLARTLSGLLFLLVPNLGLADPHPMALGSAVKPQGPALVALRNENLHVRVFGDHAEVKADLDLENLGEALTVDVGFPCERTAQDRVIGLECSTKLAVTIDGKATSTRLATGLAGREYAWKMRFAAGAKTKIVVTYNARMRNPRYENPYSGTLLFLYRLKTGADWAGSIGTLNMEVELPTDAVAWITPSGYTRTPKHIQWQLKNYEPTQDVVILFEPELNGSAYGYEKALLTAKGEERTKLVAGLRQVASQLGKREQDMQGVVRNLLPFFHLEPPTTSLGATLRESAQLIEAGIAPAAP